MCTAMQQQMQQYETMTNLTKTHIHPSQPYPTSVLQGDNYHIYQNSVTMSFTVN